MRAETSEFTETRGLDWQNAAMVLALPLAIAAVSFGCQFFL